MPEKIVIESYRGLANRMHAVDSAKNLTAHSRKLLHNYRKFLCLKFIRPDPKKKNITEG